MAFPPLRDGKKQLFADALPPSAESPSFLLWSPTGLLQ